MADIIRLRGSPHEETQRLLPWLINGTLAAEEAAAVDSHLAECAQCRADLLSEQALAGAVARLPADVEASWAAMDRRLEQITDRGPYRASTRWFRRRVPMGWVAAAPLAAAAAIALVFLNIAPPPEPAGEYRALGATTAGARTGNLVVLFSDGTSERQMRETLVAAEARLIDGPTVTGAYVLNVDEAKRDQALKQLRDSASIALAEPIDGKATP